jgi:hypothetical protein
LFFAVTSNSRPSKKYLAVLYEISVLNHIFAT